MPQLDFTIITSQTFFIFFFFLGYFIFLRTLLPLITMELKLRKTSILNSMLWFKNNIRKTLFFRLPFGKLLVRTREMINIINLFTSKKKVFFGIYQQDLLLIKKHVLLLF